MPTPFTIQKTFNAPADKVWKAITNKDQMKSWYFDLPEFKAKKGFKFSFPGGPEGGTQYIHRCEVTEVVEGRKLIYSWKYEGYAGISYVTFELFPEGNKTLLKLTHEGLDTFPKDNPDFAAGNFAAGWTQIIGENLAKFLEE